MAQELMDGLRLDQHTFVMNYLLDFNVKFASKRCGITTTTGNRWLKLDAAQALVHRKARHVEQVCDVTIEECVNELKRIAFFDHKDYAEDFKLSPEAGDLGVVLKDFKDMDTRAIQQLNMKVNSQGVPFVEIKPYDKIDALKLLLEHLKGPQGAKSVHLHITDEMAKKMTPQEISANYQVLISGEG